MSAPHPWPLPVPVSVAPKRQLKGAKRNARKSDGLPPNTRMYTWRGETYFGAADVAAEVPCDVRTVYKHMRLYKNLDRLGLPLACGGKRAGQPRIIPVSLTIEGVLREWPSLRALAKDIGWTQASVQRCYKSTGRGRAKLERAIDEWAKAQPKEQDDVNQ